MNPRPRRCTILFYDDLGRVVGLDTHESDLDCECWEEAREKLSTVTGATGFSVWRDTEFVYAEGEGAIDATATLRDVSVEILPGQSHTKDVQTAAAPRRRRRRPLSVRTP